MTDTKMTKSAGEHWVCSMLARLGWGAALTRDGLERTDILAVHTGDITRPAIEVQVKAVRSARNPNYPLGLKSQRPALSDREWFVFVSLPEQSDFAAAPRSFIVPRDHVAAAAHISHEDWRTDPTITPGTRNASVDRSRVGLWVWEGYEDRWDLLNKPTTGVPVMLPAHFEELAYDPRVGLPEQHPWLLSKPNWASQVQRGDDQA
ncbi:hypothetical protein ASG28_13065 [Frigoribacterium sp. Leaf415]|nr:hypothetical protein ASF07_13060 [Frigoribacterium sp. Leaf254]KQT40345.1 hypothetical protein ASG28_13065 [Frigoribacterium sp. Leaf415]